MKTTRYDGNDLRRVLAGMVTDRIVCSRIASQWQQGGLFDSDWANMVGGWCVKHLRKYDSPPDGRLRDIYEAWAGRSTPAGSTAVWRSRPRRWIT